jgi:hypothetical protein
LIKLKKILHVPNVELHSFLGRRELLHFLGDIGSSAVTDLNPLGPVAMRLDGIRIISAGTLKTTC